MPNYSNNGLKYNGIEIRIDGFSLNGEAPPNFEIISGTDSLLIDMVQSDTFPDNHVLKEGQTFVDPHKGTTIKVEDLSDEKALVNVDFA